MHQPTASRSPTTRLSLPDASAAGFLRAFIARDARGCGLAGDALLNRFPASAHCTVTWFLEGSAELLACGGASLRQPLARCVVGGCQTAPVTSLNRGEVHACIAMFYPDAFHALFGVDLARLQNRFVDAQAVLPAHGLELVAAVFAAPDDGERQRRIEDCIARHGAGAALPVWTRMRRSGSRLTLALASRLIGLGPRQLQRVALRQAGASLQTSMRLWRGERSFLRAQRRYLAGAPLDMAEHALDNDYADQSHMVRDCKAQTGRTPLQLARDVQSEEADWIYRLEFPLECPPDEDSPPTRSA